MKRILLLGLLLSAACDDGDVRHRTRGDAGVDGALPSQVPGVCDLGKCPRPENGVACCTPDARCGNDPSGLGLTCQANHSAASTRKCVLKDCPTPIIGQTCCTPTALCGWDPFGSGLLCLANTPVNLPTDGGVSTLCDLASCPRTDGGPAPCCQLNGQCGVDTLGNGACSPPPNCDLSKCPATFEGGPRACCQNSGECGIDSLGIGLCFPPPMALCDLAKCPMADGGAKTCCLQNGQCGVDTLGLGFCFPPTTTTCELAKCPKGSGGVAACCMPSGECGVDSLGIGVCFAKPPAGVDGGPPPATVPPDDPSITGECPSFIGMYGPIWGCCSAYGVCGQFASNQCLLPVGTQLPVGPPPPKEAGVSEPFLRCTPPEPVR